jgi:hypothetical protein
MQKQAKSLAGPRVKNPMPQADSGRQRGFPTPGRSDDRQFAVYREHIGQKRYGGTFAQ